jgi:hypothetical protein
MLGGNDSEHHTMTRADSIRKRLTEIEAEMQSLGGRGASLDDVSGGLQELANDEKWEERRSELAKEMRLLLHELGHLSKPKKGDRVR